MSLAAVEAAGWERAARGNVAGDAPPCVLGTLSPSDIVTSPPPGCTAPTSFAFSPDGSLLCCLFSPDGTQQRQLYALEPRGGEAAPLIATPAPDDGTLSHEEQLRRERARERGLGVTRYSFAAASPRLMVPGNELRVVDLGAGRAELRVLCPSAPGEAPKLDPTLSPCGRLLAFVQAGELHVASAEPGCEHETPVPLTSGATGSVTNGLAEFIAAEELSRSGGLWWSGGSDVLVYAQADDSPCLRVTIPHLASADPLESESQAYPYAGTPNAHVHLGVVRLSSPGRTVWLDIHAAGRQSSRDEEYIARVCWSSNDEEVWVQTLSRCQSQLHLTAFDPRTGARTRCLLSEEPHIGPGGWVNLSDAWRPLSAGRLLWSSERTGSRHLYVGRTPPGRRSGDAMVLSQLTAGPWGVDSLEGVDEQNKKLYFLAPAGAAGECAWPLGASERHLYSVSLANGGFGGYRSLPRRLTATRGCHSVALDIVRELFVDIADSLQAPQSVTLRSLKDGTALRTLFAPQAPELQRARACGGLPPPQLRMFDCAPGGVEQKLLGALWLPDSSVHGPPPYPLTVLVYGGPHVQLVTNSWGMRVDMRAQLLRSRGFAVLKLDSRGSSRRGCVFESAIGRAMGSVELEDQSAAVRALQAEGLVSPGRVGICGWSYGGYLSALAAVRHQSVFSCGIVGAPVTSWDGYDTGYTERYMGLPDREAAAYEASSVLAAVRTATAPPSPMLLIHGLLDENVHWRHTARLINELTKRRFTYTLQVYPEERHMPRGAETRTHMEEIVLSFLLKHTAAEAS